ncbi:MAG: 50S ribosomal protein L11 methyltransferase [Gemmatimonadales bacterium]
MTEKLSERDDRPWLAVRVESSGDSQHIVNALFEAGSLGVHEDGAAIVTHFPPGTDPGLIEAAIHAADPTASVTTGDAPKADWSEWRASVRSHTLGRITISPPWLAGEYGDRLEVIIDPAMAFGTGEHATTRGVVRLMQQLPAIPDVVADLGSGSAVLAICAAKLGAKRIAAIELDHDAIGNAEEMRDCCFHWSPLSVLCSRTSYLRFSSSFCRRFTPRCFRAGMRFFPAFLLKSGPQWSTRSSATRGESSPKTRRKVGGAF